MVTYTLFLKEKTKEITQKDFLKILKDIKKTFYRYKNIYDLRYLFSRKGMKSHLERRLIDLGIKSLDTRYKNIEFINNWINEINKIN